MYSVKSYLGEERGPDWLNIFNTSSLDQGKELIGLVTISFRLDRMPSQKASHGDINGIISEDESRIGNCEFGGRHIVVLV